VAVHDSTGLGAQARDLKRVFGMKHLAVPSERLDTLPMNAGLEFPLTPGLSDDGLDELLAGIDGILALEHLNWHPGLLRAAKRRKIPVVAYVNWEWFRGTDAEWRDADLLVCPSRFSAQIVRSYGLTNVEFLPWAIDLSRLRPRVISGPGRTFFHNAGLIDADDRKGTLSCIEAFMRVKRSNIRLIVRLQRASELPPSDKRVEIRVGNLPDSAALYDEGEVAIQPSKMEGCGMAVLEPVCCGIPTITTDHPPMADYVSQKTMRVRKKWFRRKANPARIAGIRHAYLRLPSIRDLARRIEWCADHELSGISRENRAFAEREFDPVRLRAIWSRAFAHLA